MTPITLVPFLLWEASPCYTSNNAGQASIGIMPMLTESKAFRGFSVDDIQKAKEFYGHTLGLKVSESNGLLKLRIADGNDVLMTL